MRSGGTPIRTRLSSSRKRSGVSASTPKSNVVKAATMRSAFCRSIRTHTSMPAVERTYP